MNRLNFSLVIVIICLFCIKAFGQIDSLSYSLGYYYNSNEISDEKDLIKNEDDFKEYIRGFEENRKLFIGNESQLNNDSSYMISYVLGGMECVFISDGIRSKTGESQPIFSYIIEGLRKVEKNEVKLPSDTIAALEFINKVIKEIPYPDPDKLDKDTECKFYTSYGIMKAYQPGLQEYIEGIMPGTKCIANRQAFAAGMADVIETITKKPDTPFNLGKLTALNIFLSSPEDKGFDYNSYLAGAKAAFGLGEDLIPREDVEEFFKRRVLYKGEDYEERNEQTEKTLRKLDVILGAPYSVNWNIIAARVAKENSPVAPVFNSVIDKYGGSEAYYNDFLIVRLADEDGKLYKNICAEIKDTPLPNQYKWFCGRKNNALFIGIMDTSAPFLADVHNGIVEPDVMNGTINVSWTFEGNYSNKWADFTETNIGQHIAVEINGMFIFAPKVNCRITGGSCSVSDLSAEEINLLFKDAKFTFETQQE